MGTKFHFLGFLKSTSVIASGDMALAICGTRAVGHEKLYLLIVQPSGRLTDEQVKQSLVAGLRLHWLNGNLGLLKDMSADQMGAATR